MGIQYDSVNNQVVFSGDTYVKRFGAGAVQLGNATTGVVVSDHALITAISTPATPSAGTGRLYASGAGASDILWLNSGGVAVSLTQSQAFSALQGEPTGLPNRTDSTISFNNTTREFTIAPAVTSFDVYSKGVKYTKSSAQTVTLTDVTGLHYIYFDANGVLQKSTSVWDLGAGISPVATVYWNTDLDQGRIGEERHGLVMDWATHEYVHETLGSRYVNGLGGSFTNTTFTITDGVYRDEDIRHVPGEQTQCRVFRRDASGNWTWGSKGTLYYVVQNTHLTYDNGGTLTETNSNDYVAVWFFVTNDPETPIYVIMGQRKDGNIADARNNNTYDQLVLTNLPAKEFKVLYRVILRDDASPYEEAQDLRSLAVVSSGTYVATDHNSLTNRTVLGSHPASAITVDAGAFTGFLAGTSSVQTALATLDTHVHAAPTGDTKVIYNDGGAYAAADVYYTKANGYLGVGQASPGERLHLKDGSGNGAIVLGAHQNVTAIAGTVEWTGTLLRWYDGSVWKNVGIDLTDPLIYKGAIDCSGNPNYPAADAGHTYRISVAGKIGGASGPAVEISDMLICTVDNSASGDHATVGANWDIIQANVDGVVIGPASSTDHALARWNGATGKLLQDSGSTLDDNGNLALVGHLGVVGSPQTYAALNVQETGSGDGTSYYGAQVYPTLNGSVTSYQALRVLPYTSGTPTVTSFYGINLNASMGSVTSTNTYGVYIGGFTVGTNKWDLYAADATAKNYFAGQVGIANTAPSALLTLGTAGTTAGNLSLAGGTTGVVTVQVASDAGTWSMTLPTSAGTDGYFLKTNGSGVTSWAAQSTNATTITVANEASDTTCYPVFVTDATGDRAPKTVASFTLNASTGQLTLGVSTSQAGLLALAGSTSGLVTLTTAAAAGTWTLTLPTSGGTNNYVLKTDGAGVTSWVAATTLVTPAGSAGYVQFNSGSSTFAADAALVWDNAEKRLGIGTGSPSTALHILDGNNEGLRVETSNCAYIEVGQTGGNRWRWTSLFSGADRFELTIGTGGVAPATSLWTVDTAGKLGIGGAPQATLDVLATSAWIRAMGATNPYISAQDTTNNCVVKMQALDTAAYLGTQSDHEVRFIVNNAAKAYLTTTGRLGINVAAPSYILHTSVDGRGDVQFDSHSASDDGVFLWLRRSGGTQASPAVVPAGHRLGNISFAGYYSTSQSTYGAVIQSIAIGAWSAANYGACLQFFTTTTATTSLVERMRISDAGKVGIASVSPGALLTLGTAGTTAGSLSLAGATTGVVTVNVAADAGTWSMTLPTSGGTDGYFLKTNGSGVTSWAAQSTNATTITVADETTDTTCFPVFVTTATGDQAPKTAASFALNASTGQLTLGVTATKAGILALAGSTSGLVTLTTAAVAGTWTMTLPTTGGTNGYFLQTDGNGVTTWAAAGGGAPGGSDTYVQYNNSSTFGGMDTFRWDDSTFKLILGKVGQAATLQLAGSTSGTVDIAAPATVTSYTLTLPANDGTSGQFLQTNGSGTCTWASQSYNADTFGVATETTDTTCFPIFVTTATGNQQGKLNSYLLYNSSTGLLTLGASGASKTGLLGLAGSSSGLVTMTVAATAGTWTMTLPTSGGTNGYFLQTNGSGTCTWAAVAAVPGGSEGYVQYNSSSTFAGSSSFKWSNSNSRLMVGTNSTPQATLHVYTTAANATYGSELVTNGSFTGSATGWTLGTNWAYGTNNVVLTNSGSSGMLYQAITTTSGRVYKITWKQTHSIALNAAIRVSLGGDSTKATGFTSDGVNQITCTVLLISSITGSTNLVFEVIDRTNTGTVTIDDVSVTERTASAAMMSLFQSSSGDMDFRSNNSSDFGIGSGCLSSTTGTSNNCAFGQYVLINNVSGNHNTGIGSAALSDLTTGSSNTAIGSQTLYYATTATANTAIGAYALYSADNISSVISIGFQSQYFLHTGSFSVAVGTQALYQIQHGSYNIGIGNYTMYAATSGSQNVAIGSFAGRYYGSGTSDNLSATSAIYLGYYARAGASGNTNEIVIGANAVGNGSNTATIGHTDVTKIYLRGDIYSNTAYAKAVGGTNRAMYVDSTGLVGTLSSSIRTKQDVVDMEDIGWIDRLRPVNFCYRSTPGVKQYGLIAEEVEGVNKDLVGYDWEGLPDSVTYDRLVPVLLKAVRELRSELAQIKTAMLP